MNALREFPVDATETLAAGTPRPIGARLRILGAPASPSLIKLGSGICVIGSSEGCDVVIRDPAVSRMHVEISAGTSGINVRDLGSRNGTFYLGQRVERMVLGHGASLSLGRARILIEADSDDLGDDAPFDASEYRGIFGISPSMRNLFTFLQRLERSTVPVLVRGESGVGKELVANALHEGSGVSGPLVALNCGAIPRELVTSELFGHRRGAFSGAHESRKGAFETAHKGTLFLDEIGELPLDVQPILLRALETGDMKAVGSDESRKVQVRVIGATHKDLEKEVREGRFREDLFFRLAVVKLVIPPLRERLEDIELLAQRLLPEGSRQLTPPILEQLKARRWPGNVRELRNVMQAFAVLGTLPRAPETTQEDASRTLAGLVDLSKPYAGLKDELLESFQKIYLTELLAQTKHNQTAAAKLSGIDRTHLGRLVQKYGIGR